MDDFSNTHIIITITFDVDLWAQSIGADFIFTISEFWCYNSEMLQPFKILSIIN